MTEKPRERRIARRTPSGQEDIGWAARRMLSDLEEAEQKGGCSTAGRTTGGQGEPSVQEGTGSQEDT